MRNAILLTLASVSLLSCGGIDRQRNQNFELENFSRETAGSEGPPESGYVDKPEVAVAIAEAVAMQFYGRRLFENQRPYKVMRASKRWVVQGRINNGGVGGVFEIEVSSSDGRILQMVHGE
jgi:hypothetical protein